MLPLFDDLDPVGRQALDVLHEIPGWPIDTERDRAMIVRLRREFREVDLHGEAVKLAEWLTAEMEKHPRKRKWNHRQRFTNWVTNARRFSSDRKPAPKPEDRDKAYAEHIEFLRKMGQDI